VVSALKGAGIRVSVFIGVGVEQIAAAHAVGAQVVELHTGAYCLAVRERRADAAALYRALCEGATLAASLGLEVHAGHGIDYETVAAVASIPELAELNIGHFLIGEAIFTGLEPAVRRMRMLMDAARAGLSPLRPVGEAAA
jgi:pyridoxine 5-phosphate synthase